MSQTDQELKVIKNVNIIDGTGRDPIQNGAVVIEGGRIKEVLEGGSPVLPASAQVIDGGGQTLLPGLIDAHVHMGAVQVNISDQHRTHFPSLMVAKTLVIMKETLDQGFTTVRDCGGADVGYRQVVDQGIMPGPRMNVCGQCLSQTGGHADDRLPTEFGPHESSSLGIGSVVADGVTEVRRAAREQLRRGVDHIKVMAGGGAMSPSDAVDTSQYSPEELEAVVFETDSVGKYVSAHCYSPRSIKFASKAGIRTIEHGNLLDDESAKVMKETGAILVPTVVTYEMISKHGPEIGVPDIYVRKINEVREQGLNAIRIAKEHGITIGSGSDLLGSLQIYKGLELELQSRVLGAMGAIVAATKTNAEILKWDKDLGTIESGKLADIIVVKGDLLEDISLLGNYTENITLIMQGGRIHKNIL